MAITSNDLKNGMSLNLPDGLFQVVEFQHVKPGKGGAFVRTTLKNVRSGAVLDRTFRAGEKVDQAVIDKRGMQYLYFDGTDYVLTVAETEPGIQGDRVSGARKPATLETGLVVQVPLFVNTGDKLRVDTRSGEYITRA